VLAAPHPRVAEPHCGQDVHDGSIGPTIGDSEPAEYVVVICFGILGIYIPVSVFIEKSCRKASLIVIESILEWTSANMRHVTVEK